MKTMATATPRPRPKVMTLTDAAANRVQAIIAKSESAVLGLRVGVKNGGCAGMEYTMEWATEAKPYDEVIEEKGVKVLIDPKAILFLLGTEMDYQSSALKSGFTFNNPNQTSACGCGESVQLTPAAAQV
jgi:iron-sulfur cluster assembly protein